MKSLLRKIGSTALVAFIAGVAASAGNVLGTRYVAPLIEAKLPSRVSREAEQDTPPVPSMPGYGPR